MDSKYGPGYILPDGSILNLKSNGYTNHIAYELAHIKRDSRIKCRQIINLNNWIRINDGSNVIGENIVELPIAPITEEQYSSLLEFLDYMWFNGKKFIEVGIENESYRFSQKSIFYKKYDFEAYSSDKIISEIRTHYEKTKNAR